MSRSYRQTTYYKHYEGVINIKVTYRKSVNFLVGQIGVSEHRVVQTLKEVSRLLQYHVSKGTDIKLDGLFTISYTITGVYIVDNKCYTFNHLKQDVQQQLTKYDSSTTELILDVWLKYLIDSVEKGYTVHVKGVGTLLVEEDGEGVYLKGRISPQLTKPVKADYLILEQDDIYLRVYDREKLRLSIAIEDTIRVPRRVQDSERRQYVSLADLKNN